MLATLSIVIPLYREEKRLAHLKQGVRAVLLDTELPFRVIEWIFVDDGSDDKTWEGIESLAAHLHADPPRGAYEVQAQALRCERNRGKGAALRAGVAASTGQWVLTMDADMATDVATLQDWIRAGLWDPERLDRILIGSRAHPDSKVENGSVRKVVGRMFSVLTRVIFDSLLIRDTQCGFKLYPGAVAREQFARLRCDGWAHDVELLASAQNAGVEIQENPVAWHAVEGSQIRPFRDAFGMLRELLIIRWRLAWERLFGALRNPWNQATAGVFLLGLLFLGLTYPFRGVTLDEPVQQLYGQYSAQWYKSGFEDTRALNLNNLAWYGAAFEIWPGALKEWFPSLDIFPLRKVLIGLLGLFGVLAAVRTALLVTQKPQIGFFVALLLALHPFFVGHSWINSKDGPFAAGYMWCLYYLIRLVRLLPHLSPSVMLKLGFVLGWMLGVRVGGVLILPVIGLGIAWPFWRSVRDGQFRAKKALVRALGVIGTVGVVAYVVMLAFWPAAQLRPFRQPIEALQAASYFPWDGPVRYFGEVLPASELPSSYGPELFLYSNPEVLLVGLILLVALSMRWFKKGCSRTRFQLFLIALAAIWPLVMVQGGDANLFDNARHLLFLVAPLAILAAMGWSWFGELWPRARWVAPCAFALMCAPMARTIVRLHPYEYCYFNQLVGGPGGGFQKFGADYWFLSGWEALERLDAYLAETEPDGPQRTVHCPAYLPVFFTFLTTHARMGRMNVWEKADFVVVSTRADLNTQYEGELLFQVERYGYAFFQVLDRRKILSENQAAGQ